MKISVFAGNFGKFSKESKASVVFSISSEFLSNFSFEPSLQILTDKKICVLLLKIYRAAIFQLMKYI